VSAAEFAFLAAGLLLGAAGGAVVTGRVAGRRAGRAVRVTITPGAVPRRGAATLAGDPFATASGLPARGGPGDVPAGAEAEISLGAAATSAPDPVVLEPARLDRTPVAIESPARVAIPIVVEADPVLAAIRSVPAWSPIEPAPFDLDAGEASAEEAVLVATGARSHEIRALAAGPSGNPGRPGRGWARIARREARTSSEVPRVRGGTESQDVDRTAGAPDHPGEVPEACRELEAEAEAQCQLAEAARERLQAAAAELAAARDQLDRQVEAMQAAELEADGSRFREARESARAAFQGAREQVASPGQLADAANTWLAEVDRINAEAAAAEGRLERQRASLEIAAATIDHLAVQAEAARAAVDAAEVACVYARRRAAECAAASLGTTAGDDEALEADPRLEAIGALPEAGPEPEPASDPRAGARPMGGATHGARPVVLTVRPADDERPRPAIERILAGQHAVLDEVVARLAADDQERDRWTERLTTLLETILIHAVDAAAVEVPPDHPFWGLFTPDQSRDIVAALAALGHHFDGLGGWLDNRWPDQRDLSLAVAHAGLDPMRIRQWPTNAESAELLRDAVILGADYLATVAPDLSVEDLTGVLGRDAQPLGDIWAEWERVRPALVETG
jgi:hypothetical protein